MERRKRKKKLKVGRIIITLIILGGLFFAGSKLLNFTKEKIIIKDSYIASEVSQVSVYTYNEETSKMEETSKIPRGVKIKTSNKNKTIEDINYIEITYNEQKYYINEINLNENPKEVVKETEKFVRTSVTVYKNEKDSKISSFIRKGNSLQILDYDKLDSEGNVNMYKIKKDKIEGWVYAKY